MCPLGRLRETASGNCQPSAMNQISATRGPRPLVADMTVASAGRLYRSGSRPVASRLAAVAFLVGMVAQLDAQATIANAKTTASTVDRAPRDVRLGSHWLSCSESNSAGSDHDPATGGCRRVSPAEVPETPTKPRRHRVSQEQTPRAPRVAARLSLANSSSGLQLGSQRSPAPPRERKQNAAPSDLANGTLGARSRLRRTRESSQSSVLVAAPSARLLGPATYTNVGSPAATSKLLATSGGGGGGGGLATNAPLAPEMNDQLVELLAQFYAHLQQLSDLLAANAYHWTGDWLLAECGGFDANSRGENATNSSTSDNQFSSYEINNNNKEAISKILRKKERQELPTSGEKVNNSDEDEKQVVAANEQMSKQQLQFAANNHTTTRFNNRQKFLETNKLRWWDKVLINRRIMAQLGADEASLLKWLRQRQDRFGLLKNISFELIDERPNRSINVCQDGPKILVLPNVSDIFYCYTSEQWIDKLWSDLKLSAFHYPIIVLNILIFLFGTTGNIFVCLSVNRNHQLRSVTNYFIVNLAFADFLVILICLPATVVWDLSLTWFFDTLPCKLIMFLQDVSISVSVLTLTAISIDRYYAICHPLKFKSSLSQAKRVIALIWLVSLLTMAPDLMYLSAKRSSDLVEAGLDTVLYSDCNYDWSDSASWAFQFVKTILLYLLPFLLMFCAHYRILKVLRLASSMDQYPEHGIELTSPLGSVEHQQLKTIMQNRNNNCLPLVQADNNQESSNRLYLSNWRARRRRKRHIQRLTSSMRISSNLLAMPPPIAEGTISEPEEVQTTTADGEEDSEEEFGARRLALQQADGDKQRQVHFREASGDEKGAKLDIVHEFEMSNQKWTQRQAKVRLAAGRMAKFKLWLEGKRRAETELGPGSGQANEPEEGSVATTSCDSEGNNTSALRRQSSINSNQRQPPSSPAVSRQSLASISARELIIEGFVHGASSGRQQRSQSSASNSALAPNDESMVLIMHNKSKLESRRKAAKMLTAIVVLFGICYLPVHLINFLRQFIDDIPQTDVTSTICMLAHCVCYLNSAINPIIYNHMNSVFRAEFRKFLSCLDCFGRKSVDSGSAVGSNLVAGKHYTTAANNHQHHNSGDRLMTNKGQACNHLHQASSHHFAYNHRLSAATATTTLTMAAVEIKPQDPPLIDRTSDEANK